MGEVGIDSAEPLAAPMKYDPEFYKVAYDGVEMLETFSPRELAEYRESLLQKVASQQVFIAQEFEGVVSPGLKVIEFCSGNGRLLLSLANRGLLESGLGLEISDSRVRFAEQWRRDCGLNNYENVVADVMTHAIVPQQHYDLAVCVTAAFQYFYPIDPNAPVRLLRKFISSLQPGGKVLLELYQMTNLRKEMLALNGQRLQVWEELPPADKFKFYLSDLTYQPSESVLKCEKVFVGRDGTIDEGRVHVVVHYTADQMAELLTDCGFVNVRIFENFDRADYSEGASESMVVVAERPKE